MPQGARCVDDRNSQRRLALMGHNRPPMSRAPTAEARWTNAVSRGQAQKIAYDTASAPSFAFEPHVHVMIFGVANFSKIQAIDKVIKLTCLNFRKIINF